MNDLHALAGRTFLITGAGGMLGRAFQEVLATPGVGCRVIARDRESLDVRDAAAVMAEAAERPDLILHCAANVDADDCERHPDECRRVQVGGTENIVALANAVGARLFYPQSVFIFDGRELPVTESTEPAPLSTYGRHKLEAERHLLCETSNALVVRMAGFFGGDEKDKNFVGKLSRHIDACLKCGTRRLRVGARVWQPTYTIDLAVNTLLLLALGKTGIYHMGARGEASFYDVALEYVQTLGLSGEISIERVDGDWGAPPHGAHRPMRMVTATQRLDREGLNRQREWRQALREYLLRPYFDRFRAARSAAG